MSKINGLFITGMPSVGSSTFACLVRTLLDPRHEDKKIEIIDIDQLLSWAARQPTKAGTAAKQHIHYLRQGFTMPAHVVVHVFQEFLLHRKAENAHLRLLIASGLPDSPNSLDILDAVGKHAVIHIDAAESEARQGFALKLRRDEEYRNRFRNIDAEAYLGQRLTNHAEHVEPAMRELEGRRTRVSVRVSRSQGLRSRLFAAYKGLDALGTDCPLDVHQLSVARKHLQEDHSHVNREINEIERLTLSQHPIQRAHAPNAARELAVA